MECILCRNLRYILTYLEITEIVKYRINSHRNAVWRENSPPCDKHSRKAGHIFKKHVKFTNIEKSKIHPQTMKTYANYWSTKETYGY